MKTIIITGSIATGKSTVSNYLKKLGYPLIDMDEISREVVLPGTEGIKLIEQAFGSDILKEDKSLNREKLGAYIFKNPQERETLNEILHPLIFKRAKEIWQDYKELDSSLVFVDIPLFFETESAFPHDEIWLAYIPECLQLERLMERDKLSKESAQARISSQISIEEKKQQSDVILKNTKDLPYLYDQIEQALTRLQHRN